MNKFRVDEKCTPPNSLGLWLPEGAHHQIHCLFFTVLKGTWKNRHFVVFKTCRVIQNVLFLGDDDHGHQIKSHFEGRNRLDFPLAERPGITAIF